jgi:hypothetical protein
MKRIPFLDIIGTGRWFIVGFVEVRLEIQLVFKDISQIWMQSLIPLFQ